MTILIRPVPGGETHEKLFKLIDFMGIGENALRPFVTKGNHSSGGQVFECSKEELEKLRSNSALEGDFIAYNESPGGRLTIIYPRSPKQPVVPGASARSHRQRVEDALAIPLVKRGRDIPAPLPKGQRS